MNIPYDFNYEIYKILNEDLKDFSENELKKHYILHGINENRIYTYNLPNDFNPEIYKILNEDLKDFSENELKNHYFFNGINENRIYTYNLPNDFNPEIYKILNEDLKDFSENELKQHYFFNGINENRIYTYNLPNDFNPEIYKILNEDLKDFSENELKNHYFFNGINENRIYTYNLPNDFNPEIYKILNEDLKDFSENELKQHYFFNGINENRNYNITLDYQNFNNKDYILYQYTINDDKEYNYKNILSNLLNNYNCLDTNDRLKIEDINNEYNNYIVNNNIILNINNSTEFNYNIFYKNGDIDDIHNNYKIYINDNSILKNTILILSDDFLIKQSEIIFNVNYKIISDNIYDYKYIINIETFLKNYCSNMNLLDNINYIIFNKNNNIKNLINIDLSEKYNKSINLNDFFKSKTFLFQILLPDFDNIPLKLVENINSWEDEKIWICRFDNYLSEEFIYNNFSLNIYYVYKLIYSNSHKTDLLRQCILYRFGGMYMDVSIKLLDKDFLNIILNYDYFVCVNNEGKEDMQNGLIYIKNKFSDISYIYITEIVSGVMNENLNINNNVSNIFNKVPSSHSFFYGPNTLYHIYNSILFKRNVLVAKSILLEHKKDTMNTSKNEFLMKVLINEKFYLQIKYIGYYSDIESKTKKTHYSINNLNNNHYFSVLEIIDKIIVINLKHRIDRKENILNELNKFVLSNDKIEIIDAIYDENGVIGCAKSHIKCIEYAKKNNYKNILILEDDYCFEDNIKNFNINICKFLFYNIKWDGLLLSFSEYGPPVYIRTNIENIYKFYWSYNASAYILNSNLYDNLIDIINMGLDKKNPIDWSWNYTKSNFNWFCIKNTIGYQRESFSDIENKVVSYKKIDFTY